MGECTAFDAVIMSSLLDMCFSFAHHANALFDGLTFHIKVNMYMLGIDLLVGACRLAATTRHAHGRAGMPMVSHHCESW